MTVSPLRMRAADEIGANTKSGQYGLCVATGAVTTIAAAGILLALRNTDAAKKIYLRYAAAQFVLTTAFGAAQEVGCQLAQARSWSASDTSGTALDLGGTNANANKLRSAMATSCLSAGDGRVATTAAVAAGTRTLDPNTVSMVSGYAGAVGVIIARQPGGSLPGGVLYDARDDYSPLVLGTNEGIEIQNTILMGATGVGTWRFWLEWDEGTAT